MGPTAILALIAGTNGGRSDGNRRGCFRADWSILKFFAETQSELILVQEKRSVSQYVLPELRKEMRRW